MGPPAASSPSTRRRSAICASRGRPESQVALVEAYAKEQGLFYTPDTPDAVYSDTLTLDLESRWSRAWPARAARKTASRWAR